ncbi:MAG TPA: DUF4331 family protein [Gemmatimonadales bacterium]|jgi:hypothetical protein|nr:DUF4331 family protein [Gemmatimonadales bacterium]
MQPSLPARKRLAAGLAVAAMAALGTLGVVVASDHQDSPNVELNPLQDLTDVYAFPSPTAGRIVLVMNTRAFLTPAATPTASFDHNQLYQFKIDNTGDAREDKVIQVTFSGSGASQTVAVRGPVAPPVQGSMANTVSTSAPVVTGALGASLGSASAMQVFAGPRDDSFFLDLEQFFRIIPDRKPATGPLSQLPNTPSASGFRPAGQARNYLTGYNTLSIVVELPVAELTAGGSTKLGIWGTISR